MTVKGRHRPSRCLQSSFHDVSDDGYSRAAEPGRGNRGPGRKDTENNRAEGPASSRWWLDGSSLEITGLCNFARVAAVLEG